MYTRDHWRPSSVHYQYYWPLCTALYFRHATTFWGKAAVSRVRKQSQMWETQRSPRLPLSWKIVAAFLPSSQTGGLWHSPLTSVTVTSAHLLKMRRRIWGYSATGLPHPNLQVAFAAINAVGMRPSRPFQPLPNWCNTGNCLPQKFSDCIGDLSSMSHWNWYVMPWMCPISDTPS